MYFILIFLIFHFRVKPAHRDQQGAEEQEESLSAQYFILHLFELISTFFQCFNFVLIVCICVCDHVHRDLLVSLVRLVLLASLDLL